jgi:hypothetical protein
MTKRKNPKNPRPYGKNPLFIRRSDRIPTARKSTSIRLSYADKTSIAFEGEKNKTHGEKKNRRNKGKKTPSVFPFPKHHHLNRATT